MHSQIVSPQHGGASKTEDLGRGAGSLEGIGVYLRHIYAGGFPSVPRDTVGILVSQALQRAVQKHPDLETIQALAWYVAMTIAPYCSNCSLDQYIEIVYQAARHGDFLEEARALVAEKFGTERVRLQ
jgi:hypothetical protein